MGETKTPVVPLANLSPEQRGKVTSWLRDKAHDLEIDRAQMLEEGGFDFVEALEALAETASSTKAYRIDTDGATAALAEYVRVFKAHNASVGEFHATCHDGSTVKFVFRDKPARAKKKRAG